VRAASPRRRSVAALVVLTLLLGGSLVGCSSDDESTDEPLTQPAESKDLDAETCEALYDALGTLEGVPSGETEPLPAVQAIATIETNLGASAPLESIKVAVQLISSAASPEDAEATRQEIERTGGYVELLDGLRATVDESCG
jgi:hypothetical protein